MSSTVAAQAGGGDTCGGRFILVARRLALADVRIASPRGGDVVFLAR